MKLLHITPSYIPDRGGVETHVSEVVQLQQKDHQVDVLVMPKVSSKLAVWKYMWRHRAQFQWADVVFIHDIFWSILPVYPLVVRRVITIFHGWEGVYPVPYRNKLQRWVAAQLSTAAVHVGAWIQEFYWDRPTAVIEGGIRLPTSVSSKKLDSKAKSKKEISVVFVGRLEPENDIEAYCVLLDQLLADGGKVSVTWVGDGSWRKRCQHYGEVVGMVENVDTHLAKADVVFAASYLSILNAFAHGKPVVALYSHYLKQRYLETFSGAELLLMSSDIARIKEELLAFLSTPAKYQKLSTRAQRFAKENSWEEVVGVYEGLLG